MKKFSFILILLVLFIVKFGYGQEYRLWTSQSIAQTASNLGYSAEVNFTNDASNLGKFNGLVAIVLDVDSSTTASGGGDDSLYFAPVYQVSGDWFIGDTIQWDRVNTADYHVDDDFFNSDKELIIPEVDHDSVYVWRFDPTSTTNIEGYPIWQKFKLVVLYNDSVNVVVDVRAGRH